MVRSAQTMHQSSVKISAPRHLGVQLGASKMISLEPYLQTYRIELPLEPRHLGVQSGASKIISKPKVRLAQTVHLSCIKISTISKQTKTSFRLSLITQNYHRVHPKRFLSRWYVWHKPCTYLASTLTPSPNGPKRFSSLWYVRRKPCTFLASRLALCTNGLKRAST